MRRSKKLSTKVDLTPMVDLGFLLITFFVFTSAISKPTKMDLYLPAGKDPMPVAMSTALTLIPIENNKVVYYHGELRDAIDRGLYGVSTFSPNKGVGDIIRQKQQALAQTGHKKEDLMLIIKPSAAASYQSIVNALDEALINNVTRYALVDIGEEEKRWLQNKDRW